MAKFVYNMQSILNIKYKLENQKKIAYANAQARLRSEEEKLNQYRDKRQYYENKMRGNMQEKLDVRALYECNQGIEIMKQAIVEQKRQVAAAQRGVDQAQELLNEAMKDRKTHEKLREHAFDKFMQELNAQENKEIDELVSYSYASTV